MQGIVAFLVALVLGAGVAGAQDEDSPRRAVIDEACPVSLPDWVTPAEQYAWGEICAGYVADMQFSTGSDDGAGCDARDDGQVWPDSRLLLPRFITLITAREPFVQSPAAPSVGIRCARFDATVVLDHEAIPQDLWIGDSRLPKGMGLLGTRFGNSLSLAGSTLGAHGLFAVEMTVAGSLVLPNVSITGVDLGGASVGGDLAANGSRFTGLFNAGRLTVEGGVFLDGGAEFAEVNLLGASVGGDLSANGSRFTGLFAADGLTVGGGVFLRDGAEFAEVNLRGASVGGQLAANGSRFTGLFAADGLTVGGGVFLRDGAEFAEVRLLGASVGGQLLAIGSRFTGKFMADGLTVGDSVFLGGGAEFADVGLPGASVGGYLQMQESSYSGAVDLTGASVGELMLWQGEGTDPAWGKGASLTLRNVHAKSLQARMPESWVRADGSALPVDLQGFRYDRMGGLSSGNGGDLAVISDVEPLISWIEGPSPGGTQDKSHAPQPYFQMESVLRGIGAERAADQVAYARHLDRLESYGTGLRDWWIWFGEQVWRWIIGYGVYPFRLLWWVGGLIALGTLAARRTEVLCSAGWMDGFWYSVENTLPLIGPSEGNRSVTHHDGFTRGFFHFQKVAGFVLATILVGALTLMGS